MTHGQHVRATTFAAYERTSRAAMQIVYVDARGRVHERTRLVPDSDWVETNLSDAVDAPVPAQGSSMTAFSTSYGEPSKQLAYFDVHSERA